MSRCVCCEQGDADSGITFTQGLNTAAPLATVICMACLVSALRHLVRQAATYAETEMLPPAAAPERGLLQALKQVRDWLDGPEGPETLFSRGVAMRKAVLDAIAIAER